MVSQTNRFTPEGLLSAPRRSAGVANSKGNLILYTTSTYSFKARGKTSQICVLDIESGSSQVVSEDLAASEPIWISEEELAFLTTGDNGCTTLVSQNVRKISSRPHVIHHWAGIISNLKVKQISPDSVALCCSAPTTPEGELFWPPSEPKPRTSARIYTSLFVRHWDTWSTKNRNSLWYGLLTKANGAWTLQSPGLTNLLAGTDLSCPAVTFGDAGDFDISASGIAFVAKDPELNIARYTKSDVYYVPIKDFTEKAPSPHMITTGKLLGYSGSPTFSHSGKQLAFTRMKSKQYESDKPHLMLIPDVSDLRTVKEFYETEDGEGSWELRPEGIAWSHDDSELYITAEKHARGMLWNLPASPAKAKDLPQPIHEKHNVITFQLLGDGPSLLLSCNSLTDNSFYCILDPETNSIKHISSNTDNGKLFGLNSAQVSDIWYPGSAGYDNHALVVKPSFFDESKTYPLAMFIHGGPQQAWGDSWSTRWNPALFAEQGFIVVCPNPTGSTGYGQKHVDAITDNWGGNPYKDLVKCFEYLEKDIKYIDTSRAVALGASYGGYMINWIQGHDLGRKFKALVCHNGTFSTRNLWTTEELFFPEHDFCGTLWENPEGYEKWDPSRHLDAWATPMLVIHSDLDFRLPVSEGLAMFNVLQAKGIPSKLLNFPDENHWVLKPENSIVWHREVLDWVKKFTSDGADQLESKTAQLKV